MTKERHHTDVLDARTRIDVRVGVDESNDVEWFVVQLLYNIEPYYSSNEDWREVARFDHNPDAQDGHDIVEEGLHIDILFENKDDEVQERFPEHTPPPYNLGSTVRFCVNYLKSEHEALVRDYKDDLSGTL